MQSSTRGQPSSAWTGVLLMCFSSTTIAESSICCDQEFHALPQLNTLHTGRQGLLGCWKPWTVDSGDCVHWTPPHTHTHTYAHTVFGSIWYTNWLLFWEPWVNPGRLFPASAFSTSWEVGTQGHSSQKLTYSLGWDVLTSSKFTCASVAVFPQQVNIHQHSVCVCVCVWKYPGERRRAVSSDHSG